MGGSLKPRTCEVCASDYVPSYSKQRTCSRACGWQIRPRRDPSVKREQWGHSCRVYFPCCEQCGERWTTRAADARYCSGACWQRANRNNKRRVGQEVACTTCGTGLGLTYGHDVPLRSSGRRTCAPCKREVRRRTKRSTGNHRQRARKYGVTYVSIRKREVFERDGWVCGICGDLVDHTLQYPDEMAATLDHVVPLSKGGDHVPSNVRLAHWLCNTLRGNSDIDFRLSA